MTVAATVKNARIWARAADEWYVEPENVTDALLTRETFHGRVLDPACGGGNIPRAMRRHGIAAFGSDIVERGLSLEDGWLGCRDFLTDPFAVENIVCNPPFGRAVTAEAFIRKALEIATHKIAIFVDMRFITGVNRSGNLYADHPPSRIWIVVPRPSCPPGTYLAAGNKAGGGQADFCWIVWDKSAPTGLTRLDWVFRKVTA